jgi:hypothetical protein
MEPPERTLTKVANGRNRHIAASQSIAKRSLSRAVRYKARCAAQAA